MRLRFAVPALLTALPALAAAKPAPKPAAPAGLTRETIAAFALRQVAFGSVSLLPVRFEKSRIGGPFEDGGRILYCVSSRMHGRTFGKPERPKIVIRAEPGRLSLIDDEAEVCEGHRTEPFPELEAAAGKPH
ncbi:hypothetical protein [Methylobacterium sp. A54F]